MGHHAAASGAPGPGRPLRGGCRPRQPLRPCTPPPPRAPSWHEAEASRRPARTRHPNSSLAMPIRTHSQGSLQHRTGRLRPRAWRGRQGPVPSPAFLGTKWCQTAGAGRGGAGGRGVTLHDLDPEPGSQAPETPPGGARHPGRQMARSPSRPCQHLHGGHLSSFSLLLLCPHSLR